MQLPDYLGIIAAIIQIFGYISYYNLAKKGEIHPNAASWLIWFYGNLVVCISYLMIGDFSLAGILPIACAFANIVLVIVLWRKKYFGPIDSYEKKIIATDIFITIFWITLESTRLGNFVESEIHISVALLIHILLISSAVISFIPLLVETVSDRCSEHIQPWVIWSIAYFLWLIAEIIMSAKWQLLYPSVYLLLHVIVALLVYRHKKRSIIC